MARTPSVRAGLALAREDAHSPQIHAAAVFFYFGCFDNFILRRSEKRISHNEIPDDWCRC
jgi:hypothetical protein